MFARASGGDAKGLALLAVGGYGRATLAPGSDLDLLLVHDGKRSVKAIADALWYPIWDAGMPLDHSVRTAREVRSTMDADIKVALGLLDARLVAGDRKLADAVLTRVAEQWKTRTSKWVPGTGPGHPRAPRPIRGPGVPARTRPQRGAGRPAGPPAAASLGRVAPVLADLLDDPDLDAGGRDPHRGARRAAARRRLRRPTSCCCRTRTRWPPAWPIADADFLMAAVADAGRAIAWASDDGWRRLGVVAGRPRGRAARAGPVPRAGSGAPRW